MLIKNIKYCKWYYYCHLMRVFNPIGFFLLLWPTLWALWLSIEKIPDTYVLFILIVSVFCVRSLGCIVNDYIDSNIDNYINRTKNRPFTAGLVSRKEIQRLFFILLFILICLLLAVDHKIMTMILSFIALILIYIYPYTKRYLCCPQVFLGLTFSFSILIVFSILDISLYSLKPWLLFCANLVWTVIYDTEYAMMDRKDDISFGLKSCAVCLGRYDKLCIALLQIIMLFIFSVIGWIMSFSIIFYVSLIGVVMCFIWQQILIFNRQEQRCYQAFLNNNYVGMLIFIGIVLDLMISKV